MTDEEEDFDLSDLDEEAGGAEEGGGNLELEEIVEQVIYNVSGFSEDQVEDMLVVLRERGVQGTEYDADFDLNAFLNQQVQSLKVMRAKLMSQDGRLRLSASQRDLKDLMAASRGLADMMLKHQKKILDFKRVQKIESATRWALEEADPDLVDKFVKKLEELLEDDEE